MDEQSGAGGVTQDLGDAGSGGHYRHWQALNFEMAKKGLHLSDVDKQFLRDFPDVAAALCAGMLELGAEGVSQALEEKKKQAGKKSRFECVEVIGDVFAQPLHKGMPPIPPEVIEAKRKRNDEFHATLALMNNPRNN